MTRTGDTSTGELRDLGADRLLETDKVYLHRTCRAVSVYSQPDASMLHIFYPFSSRCRYEGANAMVASGCSDRNGIRGWIHGKAGVGGDRIGLRRFVRVQLFDRLLALH